MPEEEFELTNEQKLAINHNKGHLRIIACAGSGKTEVVSRRISNIIKNGAKPKSIVAITFTEKAAEELKMRVRAILDKECPERSDLGDMFVGTIHSFAAFMLKELLPEFKSYDVLDEAQRVAFVSKPLNYKKINLYPLQNNGEEKKLTYYTTVGRFLYSIDIMMREGIVPEKLSNQNFAKSYLEYQKLLHEEKYLDFSTMLFELVQKVKTDKTLLKRLNDSIKHVIIDEYQDVDSLQENLLEILSKGAESVCVVGDDDQCIYQWRGSNVDNIVKFDEKYLSKKYKVTDVNLDTNFRSTEAIIHTAREFIKKNINRLKTKSMKSSSKLERKFEDGDIQHIHFENEQQEFGFIVEKIKELKDTDFLDKRNNPFSLSLADFAVLVRTNEDAKKIINCFESNGIDCIAYSGESVFEQPEIIFAMECILYIFDINSFKIGPTQHIDKDGIMDDYTAIFDNSRFHKADPKKFFTALESIKKDMLRLKRKGKKDYLGDKGLQAIYHRLLSAFGSERFEFGDVYNYNFAVLSDAISDYESVWVRLRTEEVIGFFYFVKAFAESYYGGTRHSDPTLIDAVKVITIHKAKGLEFPVVFIPCAVEKRKLNPYPTYVDKELYPADRYGGNEEDERRTFYTAITRSEKYLFITGSKQREGRKKEYKPHNFVEELSRKYITGKKNLKRKKSDAGKRPTRIGVFGTSFSELMSFDRCPYDYKLRHIIGYNAGVPVTFGYGTNIHNILNMIHKDFVSKKELPSDSKVDTLFDKSFKLRYATKAVSEGMKKSGKQIVKNYINIHKSDFNRILETEKKFEFVINPAIISGQIDLIKNVDESGKIVGVEIIDFKTENDSSAYKLDHDKQLRLYSIACLKSLGINPKKACVHYLDKSGGRKEFVDISQKALDETEKNIEKDLNQILVKKEFKACPSTTCQKCDYRLLCMHKKK